MSGVRECHQGVLGHKVAEERLRESQKEFAYLTRESDIKRGRFIVSNLTKTGTVKHTVIPNSSAKKNYVNLEEASDVLEKVILSMEDCFNSIPPPEIDTDAIIIAWMTGTGLLMTSPATPVTLLLTTTAN